MSNLKCSLFVYFVVQLISIEKVFSLQLKTTLSPADQYPPERYGPPSNDTNAFREMLQNAKHIVVITGAGISAESGVPTYTGAWSSWRGVHAQDLDSPDTFKELPFLVWEFNHYRREIVLKAGPNAAHKALADYEKILKNEGKGRKITVITQNIDGLHTAAGSHNVIEMHGSLFKTQCLKCGDIAENRDSPIWPSLKGRGDPEPADYTQAEEEDIPHCKKPGCGGRIRPYIVWYGEELHKDAMEKAEAVLKITDLGLVIGTSCSGTSRVSMFIPSLAGRGVPTAEFNIIDTQATPNFKYQFKGYCTDTVPEILLK